MTITSRLASGLVIVTCALGSQACVHWTANDPRLVRGETPAVYRNCTSTAAYFELARFDLASHIGQPFPELTLIGRDKEARRISSYRGKRLAVLIAGQCPTTAMWLKELGAQGWAIPAGFDELLLLVPASTDRRWDRMVLECPTTHYVGWPLEGYLEIVRWNPILYEVGADGTFEGFWDYDEFKNKRRKYYLGTSGPQVTVLGTWKGESICMDKNRPACKNEVVVYRFEPIAGATDRVLWLADKILDGKRVPMGRGEMTLDSSGTKLTWDFTIHETHGIWQLEIEGDHMTGTLVLLPDRTLGRKVSARRVTPEEVPEAPPSQAYEE